MRDKPHLILIDMEPLDKLPRESYDAFKELILGHCLKPSIALHKIMEKYKCDRIDTSSIIHLVEHAYPEIDISRNSFTFKINDSGYPNTKMELNNDGFDELVEEMRTLPPMEW